MSIYSFSLRRFSLLLVVGSLLLLSALSVPSAKADAPNDFSEDFNGFTGAGFAPSPSAGQLDSDLWIVTGLSDGDLAYGDTATSGDFARGTSGGGVTTGGVYAFDVGGGNTALGVQPGADDFTPGTFELRVENDTGDTIDSVVISYTIYVRNDQPRANSFNFAYSLDGATFTPVSALNYTSPEASTGSAWIAVPRTTTINGLNIVDGDFFYLRWISDDVSGSNSRDEFALDDVVVDLQTTAAATIALFEAVPQSDGINLMWATIEEPDTMGFNLYRATTPTAPDTQLNGTLIEAQGQGGGASYEWLDVSAEPGVTYFYWLEDVDYSGTATQHGPVSATISVPTAVTLDALDAGHSPAPYAALAVALLALGAACTLRRRAT